jgi:UTP:GlnB (protein PII) uridylyltransferase
MMILRRKPKKRAADEIVGDEHAGKVHRRRASAADLLARSAFAERRRIAEATPGYLLAHDAGSIARHAGLLTPLPGKGEVRVAVTPTPDPFAWRVDVVARDRPRLLAAFTRPLADHAFEVDQAVLATWDDGAALQAFVVRADVAPEPYALQDALVASLASAPTCAPVPDAKLTFDNDASPLYTQCSIRATDRSGLLHAFAVAIAAAGVDIHASRVTTRGGVALDYFDLDVNGRKLSVLHMDGIRANVARGVS